MSNLSYGIFYSNILNSIFMETDDVYKCLIPGELPQSPLVFTEGLKKAQSRAGGLPDFQECDCLELEAQNSLSQKLMSSQTLSQVSSD